jgi:hypothetical protein
MIGDFVPKKLNYDELVPQGIPTPVSSSLALDAGTWLDPNTGEFEYVTTWMRKNGDYETIEGNADLGLIKTAIITAALEGVIVTKPTFVPAQVTHWRVYRRFKETGGPFFLVAEESGNTTDIAVATTTFIDHGDPNKYNTSISVPTRNTQQLTIPSHMAYWRNKLWYGYNEVLAPSNGGRLAYSLTDSPDYIPSDNFFIVGDSSEKFVKLLSTETALIIIKEKSIWRIDGISEDNFILSQVQNYGAIESQCNIVGLDQRTIYFLNKRGIWEAKFDQEPRLISDQILKDFEISDIDSWSAVADTINNWIIFQSDVAVFVYDPINSIFIGEFTKFSSDLFMFRDFWGAVQDTDIIDLYDYTDTTPSGVLVPNPTSFAYLGSNIGQDNARVKLFRNVTVFDALENETTTSICSFVTVNKDLDTATVIGSFNLNSEEQSHTFNIGRSNRLSPFGFTISNSSGADWAIAGIDIEYEEIGNW